MIQLNIGDVTFQKAFSKIGFDELDNKVTASFKPPKGRQFVTLLLGDVPSNSIDCDPEKMLNDLGFYRRDEQ